MKIAKNLANILIRKACLKDAEGIAKVHIKAWQQSYRDILPKEYLDNISFLKRLESRRKILSTLDPNQIDLVAIYEEQIIGFCDAGKSREAGELCKGEVYAIYLLDDFKGLGIGQSLWQEAEHHLVSNSLSPYITCVLEQNTVARKFYEKNGGRVFKRKQIEIGMQAYSELIYIFSC